MAKKNKNQVVREVVMVQQKQSKSAKKRQKKKAKQAVMESLGLSGSGAYSYGRGKYDLGRSIGAFVGSSAGGMLGQSKLGARLGGMAGKSLQQRISGNGAYRINSLVNGQPPEVKIPLFGPTDSVDLIDFIHAEYICDINTPAVPTAFTVQSFNINPGLNGVFPLLSQIAQNFEEYELVSMAAVFTPVVSESSTSGQMGEVLMATCYNPANPSFASKAEMEAYAGKVTGRPCDDIVHGIECDPLQRGGSTIEYVRAGAVAAGEDIKTYDHAKFQIATNGLPFLAGTQIGYLTFTYRIRLRKVKFWSSLGKSIMYDEFYSNTGITTTLPLGTAPMKSARNTLGCSLTKAGTSVLTLPDNFAGQISVVYYVVAATNVTLIAGDCLGAGNVALITVANGGGGFTANGTSATTNMTFGSATVKACLVQDFNVTQASVAGGNTLTLTANIITGAPTVSFIRIYARNPLIGTPATTDFVAV